MKTYLKDLTPDEVIRRLKAGEVVRYRGTDYIIKYIDGVLCTLFDDGDVDINSILMIRKVGDYYFETPDELKLEVDKCYKTRDGRKAFVSYYDEKNKQYHGCVLGRSEIVYWYENGSWYEDQEHDVDIISEWSDDDVAED